ncbi:MAG: barstar family protein [Caulobacter sp.]
MKIATVRIPGHEIVDDESFHDVLARALGFPDFYGRNLDALADCLSSVDEPEHGMVVPVIAEGDFILLRLDNAHLMRRRCEQHYGALIEIIAHENHRRVAAGREPVLGLVLVGDLSPENPAFLGLSRE